MPVYDREMDDNSGGNIFQPNLFINQPPEDYAPPPGYMERMFENIQNNNNNNDDNIDFNDNNYNDQRKDKTNN